MDDNGIAKIQPANLEALRGRLEVLNRRAAKLGCNPVVLEILGEEQVERTNDRGIKYTETLILACVHGTTPKLAGWTLVASVEWMGEERLIRCVPGLECPEQFRTGDFTCDHCKSSRNRKQVFILRHENGRHVQVGRNCIADFLGGLSPETLLAQAEWLMEVQSEMSDAEDGWGGSYAESLNTEEFLAATSIVIRRMGWVARSAANETTVATADNVWYLLKPYARTEEAKREHARWIEKHNLYVVERDQDLAKEILAWASALPTTGVSDYLYNLGVACRAGFVTNKTAGIVASAVQAYLKHQEREAEIVRRQRADAAKVRGHVGTVGKREVFGPLTVRMMKYFDSQYGVKTLVKFEDATGNLICWWASKELDELEQGDVVTIKATVKEHGDYNGTPQTIVQRAAIIEKHALEVAA